MKANIEKIRINFAGKEVRAHKLTVSSEIPIDIDIAWAKVQESALLEFVAKGKVKFKPIEGRFPKLWVEGSTVKTNIYAYGVIPIGGVHTLIFEKIDSENKVIESREWDKLAKVWNHRISMIKLNRELIHYEDEIIIYGGLMTSLISIWAKLFYKHRQRRWGLVAQINR